MNDLADRYARLVAQWDASVVDPADRARVASEARAVAAEADSTWYRIQSLALAAAADAMDGLPLDLHALLDADPPSVDDLALARLAALLPGDGEIAVRLGAHRKATTVPPDRLESVAAALLALFRRRAAEDLELPAAMPALNIALESGRDDAARMWLDRGGRDHRLVLNRGRRWTAAGLVRAVVEGGVPGGHLVEELRPAMPAWSPSPQTTVDRGMHAVAREVLLGDHELGYELGRIGRSHGLQWSGEQVVGVERGLEEIAPALAALAISGRADASALTALGMDEPSAAELLVRWQDPLDRAECVARAAGPPLVRAWLVQVGQTTGLARLVRERLVPSQLRGAPARV